MMVKNISDGPRGIWSEGVVVMLAPGESRDLDVSDGDLKAARKAGWFNLGGSGSEEPEEKRPAPIDLSKYTDEELRAYLAEREVRVDGRLGRDKLLAEAEKVRAAEAKA